MLKAQQGSIVTRETIESTLWPREVVGLGSVNNTISRLRRLLGDTPKMPTYVETVARKGYRLIKQLDYRLLWFKKPKIKMIVNTSTAFLVLISLLTAVRYSLALSTNQLSSAASEQHQKPVLHRDPEMQKAMLAKNMTFQQLTEKYNIVLLSK